RRAGGRDGRGHRRGPRRRRGARRHLGPRQTLTSCSAQAEGGTRMTTLAKEKTALLVMDLQNDVVAMLGDKGTADVEHAAAAVATARAAGLPVIYVVVGFRPGYPELPPGGMFHARVASTGRFVTTPPGADIAPGVRPQADDIVVVKHRISAFSGSDLDMIL